MNAILEVIMSWDNFIGHFYQEGGWGAFKVERKITIPAIVIPMTIFPTRSPEWLCGVEVISAVYFEEESEMRLETKPNAMGYASQKEFEDTVKEFLDCGWRHEGRLPWEAPS